MNQEKNGSFRSEFNNYISSVSFLEYNLLFKKKTRLTNFLNQELAIERTLIEIIATAAKQNISSLVPLLATVAPMTNSIYSSVEQFKNRDSKLFYYFDVEINLVLYRTQCNPSLK